MKKRQKKRNLLLFLLDLLFDHSVSLSFLFFFFFFFFFFICLPFFFLSLFTGHKKKIFK